MVVFESTAIKDLNFRPEHTCMTINVNDIDLSLAALNTAVKEHYLWTETVLCLNLFGGPADNDIISADSHLYCRFSKWLATCTQREGLDRDKVLAIELYHQSMHHIARTLAQAVISGTATRMLVSQYHEQQQAFIDSIDTYKSYLFSYRNQHDTLTGLPLRHLLYQDFSEFQVRCRRNNTGLYVLMMDIDRFKSVNDTWGHNAGDDVLQQVAQQLKASIHDTERLYRFGGEEFILLLEAQDHQTAQSAAERIRHGLAGRDINISGHKINITVTGGLACVQELESLHEVIGRADKAMYYGKNNGRNCCVMSLVEDETYRILTP